MNSRLQMKNIAMLLLATAYAAGGQTTPSLSLTVPIPGLAEISWPSNFAGWQLVSATNLGATANWQPVLDMQPLPVGDSLVVFISPTNASRFFRLQQVGGGAGCVFHAAPATISPGDSSTLSWCPLANTTYQLLPGPGTVTGSNYIVMPSVTTVYTLIASNAAGVFSNFTTVTVASATCPFANAAGYDCTLNFSYSLAPSSASYIFIIIQSASLTFHVSRVALNGNVAVYTGTFGGNASVNDSETIIGSPPPITIVGSDVPLPGQGANLTIDCGTGTYTFDVQPVIDAEWTPGGTQETRVGSVFVNSRALPLTYGAISSSESLPARGPLWVGTGDWYFPGGLGPSMFLSGIVTDTSGGDASVSWTFTPTP